MKTVKQNIYYLTLMFNEAFFILDTSFSNLILVKYDLTYLNIEFLLIKKS